MNDLWVFNHLGMGDEIICNGLIRELCKTNEKVIKFTQPQYVRQVRFMYRDLQNLTIIPAHYGEANQKIQEINPERLIIIGDRGAGNVADGMLFDEWFYSCAGIDFEKRWDSFNVKRDIEFYYDGPFIFMHDDSRFRMKKPESDLRIIHAHDLLSENIFDYSWFIENAQEVHVIESAFLFLADSLSPRGKLFAHRYARHYPRNNTPTLKHDWEILR